MANVTFSFQKQGGDKIHGTELSFEVFPIWQARPVTVFDVGLIKSSAGTSGARFRYFAPQNNPVKSYVYAKGGSTVSDLINPKAAENFVDMDIVYEQIIGKESLDMTLFDKAGQINSIVVADSGFAGRRYAAMKWYKAALKIAFDYKDVANTKNIIELSQSDADEIQNSGSDILGIVKSIQDAISGLTSKVDKYNHGIPKSQLVILCSQYFYDLVGRVYSALGHNPNYVETSGQKVVAISEIPLNIDVMMGANITADLIHSTETLDTTNFWAVVVDRRTISAQTGVQDMYQNTIPFGNNQINGLKGIMGLKPFAEFKSHLISVVKAKASLVDPTA